MILDRPQYVYELQSAEENVMVTLYLHKVCFQKCGSLRLQIL